MGRSLFSLFKHGAFVAPVGEGQGTEVDLSDNHPDLKSTEDAKLIN